MWRLLFPTPFRSCSTFEHYREIKHETCQLETALELAQALRDKYPTPKVEGGGGYELIQIRLREVEDDRTTTEIMDWLRQQVQEKGLAYINMVITGTVPGNYYLTRDGWYDAH